MSISNPVKTLFGYKAKLVLADDDGLVLDASRALLIDDTGLVWVDTSILVGVIDDRRDEDRLAALERRVAALEDR